MRQNRDSKLSVSVIIPTYNRAAFVANAVDSLLGQTRVPEEIIVVDDGSTDETPGVLAPYGDSVTFIRQENQGRSVARNVGLRHATGDLIVFLDSDDQLTPTSIERRAQILERSPEVGVVYGDMHVVNTNGERLGSNRQYMPGARPSGFVFADLAIRCFVQMPAMIRRTAMGGNTFDPMAEPCEDYDFWRRIAVDCQFQYFDEPIGSYRVHAGNTFCTHNFKMKIAEVSIQRQFFAMPEFAALPRSVRARIYRNHGAKCESIERRADACRYFARSISAAPWQPIGYGLLLLSLLSPRLLTSVVLLRQKLTRKDIRKISSGQTGASKSQRSRSGDFVSISSGDANSAPVGSA